MSIARYRRLLEITRAYPALYAWLANGHAALEDGDDLAEALALRGPRAMRERNRLIAEAAEIAHPGGRSWRQARALHEAIQSGPVSRDRSKLSRTLRDAAFYADLPTTHRQLYNIIKTEKEAAQFQYTRQMGR